MIYLEQLSVTPTEDKQRKNAGYQLNLLHGRLDRIDLDKIQELFGGMRAVISFWRDDAEVSVEFYVLERRCLQEAVLDRLLRGPGRHDRHSDLLFHGPLDGFRTAERERQLEISKLDPVLFQAFQDDLAGARAFFSQDERLFGPLDARNIAPLETGVGGRYDHHELIREEGVDRKPLFAHVAFHQGDIDLSGVQLIGDDLRVAHDEGDVHLGDLFFKCGDDQGEEVVSDGGTRADGQRAFDRAGYLADILLGLGIEGENFLRAAVEYLSRGGKVDAVAGPVEQTRLIKLFHGLYLEAHRGLREMDELRCL